MDLRTAFGIFAGVLVVLALIAYAMLPSGPSFKVVAKQGATRPSSNTELTDIITDESEMIQDEKESFGDDSDIFGEPASDDPHTLSRGVDASSPELSSSTVEITRGSALRLGPIPDNGETENAHNKSAKGRTHDQSKSQDETPATALEQIKSLEYALMVGWFSVVITPMQYYVGVIGYDLETKGDTTGFYTNFFLYCHAGAVIASPVAGYAADKYGIGFAQGVATLLSVTSFFLLATSIPLPAHAVGIALYGTARLFTVGTYFSHVAIRFGYENYGTLAGLGLFLSSMIALAQYPLIALASNGHDVLVNLSCGCVILAVLPYCVWLNRRERLDYLALANAALADSELNCEPNVSPDRCGVSASAVEMGNSKLRDEFGSEKACDDLLILRAESSIDKRTLTVSGHLASDTPLGSICSSSKLPGPLVDADDTGRRQSRHVILVNEAFCTKQEQTALGPRLNGMARNEVLRSNYPSVGCPCYDLTGVEI